MKEYYLNDFYHINNIALTSIIFQTTRLIITLTFAETFKKLSKNEFEYLFAGFDAILLPPVLASALAELSLQGAAMVNKQEHLPAFNAKKADIDFF